MSKPSRRRFVIGSITILYLLIGVSSFAQKANDPGAHYRELAATNRGLASDYRNRAQSWRDLADKARARQSDSNSAAMKQILADQIAQDDKEAAQAIAEADRLEQKAREFDQKAQETSGTGEVHGPTLPLGGSEANGGAAPNENPKSATSTTNSENANPLPPPSAPIVADSAQQSPNSSGCGCEPLPTWPKGKAPEVGSVYQEVSNNYLENLFSNRAELYGGDWRPALLALAHDIDPTGQLKISSGPAPTPANPDFHVREGLVTDEFINGVPPAGQRRYNFTNGRELAWGLTHTLARTRRYGEPTSGLREHCLLLGHFIAEDLNKVPIVDYTTRHDPRAGYIAGFAGDFRRAIVQYASYGSPRQHEAWGKNIPREFAYPNQKMALDEYDIADAALDIMFFRDEKTRKDVGWFNFANLQDDRFAADLIDTAAGKGEFQPAGAKVDPRQEAVACKAFNLLLTLALHSRKDSDQLRTQIRDEFQASMYSEKDFVPSINPRALAIRRVLASDGPGSAAEASATAEQLFQYGSICFQNCKYTQPWRRTEGTTVLELLVSLGKPGPNNPFASTISDYIKNKTDALEKDLKILQTEYSPPQDDKCKRQLLAQLTAPPTLTADTAGKACAPPPCDFKVDSMPFEDVELKLETHPGIVVVPKRYYPWPADTLDRSQPFFVEVWLSYDDARRQGKSLPVKIEVPGTGRSEEVILSGIPRRGPTVYSTDAPIIFEHPFDIAGPSDLVKSPWDSKNLESLKLKNGDLVKVSFKDSSTTFRFFNSWVQQGIARNEDGFTDLTAEYQQILATSPNAGEIQEIRKRLQMISNARHVINDYHPADPKDQLTDMARCFIGNAYHQVLREGPPTDQTSLKSWKMNPIHTKRFGTQFTSAGEETLIFQAIDDSRAKLNENFLKTIPTGFALGMYHIVTQLSGANQMWTVVYGTDEDGNPVDLTGRLLAGVGAASGALFSVASSKYLTDLSPSAKGRAKSIQSEEAVDKPTEADYEINPDTPQTTKRFIEGARTTGNETEPDINLARRAYGPNAVFRPPDPSRPHLLQIGNRDCLIEVTRGHLLEGTGENYPAPELRSAAAIEGHVHPGEGMSTGGYTFLIEARGGKATNYASTLKGLKQWVDANYFVMAVVETRLGGVHAVDVREFKIVNGREYVWFSDPYVGREVGLPVCDFREVFYSSFHGGGRGEVGVADFGQAKPIK